ncbi:hypothetical protein AB0A70_16405 [Streptomyces morookaense]
MGQARPAARVTPEVGRQALKELGLDIGPVLAGVCSGQRTFLLDHGCADQ